MVATSNNIRRAVFGGVFLLFSLTCLSDNSPEGRAIPEAMRPSVDQAVTKIKPALVRIRVVTTQYQDGREMKNQSVGSGAIITKEGHLVTNHHVAGHAVRIFCTLSDREEIEAELVGTDALTDICVLRLKPEKPREFPVAEFGDSSEMKVGNSVLALGSPMALSQSVTLGIISNVEMVMPRFWGPSGRLRQDGEDVGLLVRWIAHDAQIYGGNSGGPLVNLSGEIIGINEIRMGLSGAIPGNLARQVTTQIIRDGKVRRAWLGCELQPLLKQTPLNQGVLVSSVLSDTPTHTAGLRPGDLILRIGTTQLYVRHDEEMPALMGMISDLPIGKPVDIELWRDGERQTVQVSPIEREELRPRQSELKAWGVTVRNLSLLGARELKRPSREGVLVTSVRPGGPANEAKPGLQSQDVIVRVNDESVNSVADLVSLTRKLTEGKTDRTSVLVTYDRKDRRYMTVIRLGMNEWRDPGLEATKAWLPVETEVISRDIAALLKQPSLTGFYVTRVYVGGSAEKAGLKTGDFIVAVDDEKLTATAPEHEEELPTLIRQYDPGTEVKLAVIRDGKRMVVPVTLERSPHLPREMKKYRNEEFEFAARDIAFYDQAEEQWPTDQTGVLVEEVRPGSWADLGMLYPGDLILEIDGQSIQNVETLRAQLENVNRARKAFLVIKILRGINTKYLSLEPNWSR